MSSPSSPVTGSPSGSSTVAVKENANKAFLWFTSVLWQLYRPLLSGPAELLIPAHTRDAFFQLWCDLRTNVPKDKKWLKRHAAALKPHTTPGWIALSACLMFLSAGGCAALCLILGALAALTYMVVGIVLVAGVISAFWLLLFSGIFFVTSIIAGWTALCGAAGYAMLASTIAVLTYVYSFFVSKASDASIGDNPMFAEQAKVEEVQMSSDPITSKGVSSEASKAAAPGTSEDAQPPPRQLVNEKRHIPQSTTMGYNSSNSSRSEMRSTPQVPDLSPGRAPISGAGNLQRTVEGKPLADYVAEGGPTVKGRDAAAVHPSTLGGGYPQAVA